MHRLALYAEDLRHQFSAEYPVAFGAAEKAALHIIAVRTAALGTARFGKQFVGVCPARRGGEQAFVTFFAKIQFLFPFPDKAFGSLFAAVGTIQPSFFSLAISESAARTILARSLSRSISGQSSA